MGEFIKPIYLIHVCWMFFDYSAFCIYQVQLCCAQLHDVFFFSVFIFQLCPLACSRLVKSWALEFLGWLMELINSFVWPLSTTLDVSFSESRQWKTIVDMLKSSLFRPLQTPPSCYWERISQTPSHRPPGTLHGISGDSQWIYSWMRPHPFNVRPLSLQALLHKMCHTRSEVNTLLYLMSWRSNT